MKSGGQKTYKHVAKAVGGFFRRYWPGIVVIGIATIIFFLPLITRIDSYSEGGDVMFNAWTLERNHSCLEGDNCPSYVDGNIYFPNKDTMLYSETQLSTGVLTLPLSWISDNPWFANNVWTIVSFFLTGLFMYGLAMYLSKGNQFISIATGLVFAYAPFKMAAVSHLQNLSILYLPLATLMILKFFNTNLKRYLIGLFISLIILFYASWYQMVFAGIAIVVVVVMALLLKLVKWKPALKVTGVVVLAALSVLPLATEFIRFSHTNDASFSVKDQTLYSSSLVDYILPYDGTILGKAFYQLYPNVQHNAYNLDSYSYHGLILYAVAIFVLVAAIFLVRRTRKDKENKKTLKMIVLFSVLALVGFVISLGPLLKIFGNYSYGDMNLAVPLPWLVIDVILPQLTFIRAIGRASVITLFALCCLLAFMPLILQKLQWRKSMRYIIYAIIGIFIIIELMPTHMVKMSESPQSYNMKVPAVYKFIKEHKEINNIVIIAGDNDYKDVQVPTARAEWVLWAGYHNRNIYNGYSGYTPPSYFEQYGDFKNLDNKDITQMKALDIRYVIIDKLLSSTKPELIGNAESLMPEKLYEDERFALFKI